MAILESPERLGTASMNADAEQESRASLRRRPSVRSTEPASNCVSNYPESESAANKVENDLNDGNLIGNRYVGVAESASEEQVTESASEGLSSGNKEEEKVKEKGEDGSGKGIDALAIQFDYRPSAPAHRRIRESPLSSTAIFQQSHAGLFNLCIVVLVAVNSRLIIENLMKYGLLIKYGFWFSPKSLRDWPLLMCCLSLSIFPVAAFLVEKSVQQKNISEWVAFFLHVIITTTEILYPVLVILKCDSAVLSGASLMFCACIVWLKLVSFAHTNYDLRVIAKSLDKVEVLSSYWNMDYTYDVSFKRLAYFMVAPTLCYQPSYPRTSYIRKGWVARQLFKMVIFMGLMGFIIEQYINPIVRNSQHPLKGDLLYAIERVLKLSVPNLYLWLCMFYNFFHLWLNVLAEILRFGDREFYKDWWNARTVEEYWRMWNMPVHKWMIRHVYIPCLRNGIPKAVAIVIAFLVSALFHELCIAVPCHLFKFWACIGIMFQIPLVVLTNLLQAKFKSSTVGNMLFWCFFCIVGQPMCVLLYYHDMMNRKASER